MPADLERDPRLIRELISASLSLPPASIELLGSEQLGEADGNGYMSDLSRVRARILSADGAKRDLSLLVKQCILDHVDNEVLKVAAELTTEIKMYKEVLPEMERLLIGSAVESLWAHCIGHFDNRTLILEDLKELGYSSCERVRGLDYPHASVAVRGLARLHAASLALQHAGRLQPQDFSRFVFSCGSSAVDGFITSSFEYLHSIARATWSPEWKDILENVARIPSMAVEKLAEISRLEESKVQVLNHGDPWVNNIMFRRNEDGSPESVRFVDFQLSHYNSFAFDLHFLMNTSLSTEVIHHIERLYEEYHGALVSALEKLGLPPTCHPTLQVVLDELQRTEFFGLFAAVCIAPVVTAGPEAGPLKENKGYTLAELEARKMERFRTYEYTRRIQIILRRSQLGGAFKRLFI